MKEVTIEVISRQDSGKGVARKMRAVGKIPGVVYGKGEESLAIEMDHAHFHAVMRKNAGENPLVNLIIDGKTGDKMALIRDMQRDPIDGKLMHIDFQHISLTEKIRVRVPLVLEGVPDGVKNFGGIVNWMVRDVEVSCLPRDIPEKFVVDITELKIHESLHVKNLVLEKGEILASPEETIVSVVPPTIIKEPTPAPGAEGEAAAAAAAAAAALVEGEEGAAEPEVIAEKKTEERKAEREKGKDKEKK